MFLTKEFVLFGLKFQNWMLVFAAMIILFLVYLWITVRRDPN